MIVHSDGIRELTSEKIREKCPNCDVKNNLKMIVLQQSALIYGISFLPTGRVGMVTCSNCEKVIEEKDFNDNLQNEYELISKKTKTPFKFYTGLTILSSLVLCALVFVIYKNSENGEYILSPQKGDIYEIELEDAFTIYKVKTVTKDSVFLLVNQYQTNKITGLEDLKDKGDNAYFDEIFSLSKKDIKELFDEGVISDIDRE